LTFTLALVTVVLGSIVGATLGLQQTFLQGETVSRINLRGQLAMNRIVEVATQAVTSDAAFAPLRPTTGVGSHCLRFRLFDSFDLAGDPIYDNDAIVYIYGPDGGAYPAAGLIIGRGPGLLEIHGVGAGGDGLLGTTDDIASASLAGGLPAVELLIPAEFAPRTGEMFTVDVLPPPVGPLLRFTLRLNAVGRDGNFVLNDDLVLSERVALRQ
jgi:hypothetical protein